MAVEREVPAQDQYQQPVLPAQEGEQPAHSPERARRGRPAKYATEEERREAKREYLKNYAKTERGRKIVNEANRRYQQSAKGREKINEIHRRSRSRKRQQAGNDIFIANTDER